MQSACVSWTGDSGMDKQPGEATGVGYREAVVDGKHTTTKRQSNELCVCGTASYC